MSSSKLSKKTKMTDSKDHHREQAWAAFSKAAGLTNIAVRLLRDALAHEEVPAVATDFAHAMLQPDTLDSQVTALVAPERIEVEVIYSGTTGAIRCFVPKLGGFGYVRQEKYEELETKLRTAEERRSQAEEKRAQALGFVRLALEACSDWDGPSPAPPDRKPCTRRPGECAFWDGHHFNCRGSFGEVLNAGETHE
jgi:hypothetical protein